MNGHLLTQRTRYEIQLIKYVALFSNNWHININKYL